MWREIYNHGCCQQLQKSVIFSPQDNYFASSIGVQSIAISVNVCLSTIISQKPKFQTLPVTAALRYVMIYFRFSGRRHIIHIMRDSDNH